MTKLVRPITVSLVAKKNNKLRCTIKIIGILIRIFCFPFWPKRWIFLEQQICQMANRLNFLLAATSKQQSLANLSVIQRKIAEELAEQSAFPKLLALFEDELDRIGCYKRYFREDEKESENIYILLTKLCLHVTISDFCSRLEKGNLRSRVIEDHYRHSESSQADANQSTNQEEHPNTPLSTSYLSWFWALAMSVGVIYRWTSKRICSLF